MVNWFDVIKEELTRSDVLPKNVYNVDETGIMLSMLGSVRVLESKDDRRDYDYSLSERDYDSFIGPEWIRQVFDPQTEARAGWG